MGDLTFLYDGTLLSVHPASQCTGQPCCIHNPSAHPLSHAPLHWRADRSLMERTCSHGVGHPDPDDLAYKRRVRGDEYAYYEGIHGCDGCCRTSNEGLTDD